MDPDDLSQGNGKEPVRIIIPEIIFCRKREFPDVLKRPEFIRINAQFVKLLPVEGHVHVYA